VRLEETRSASPEGGWTARRPGRLTAELVHAPLPLTLPFRPADSERAARFRALSRVDPRAILGEAP
jgi:hypothetical protein